MATVTLYKTNFTTRNSCLKHMLKFKIVLFFAIFYVALYSARNYLLFYDEQMEVSECKISNIGIMNINEYQEVTSETHPLENYCKYAVLDPFEKTYVTAIADYPWDNITCNKIMSDIVKFKHGILTVDQDKALTELGYHVICMYRPFAGTLNPKRTTVEILGPWKSFTSKTSYINDDQIEVQCYEENGNESNVDYIYAFAQVPSNATETFQKNTEDLLSVNIIVLDSTSLNAFRRHMPKTVKYFTDHMGAMYLEGHIKVADNSMVNLLPLLTGLRYGNQSEDMPSDYPLDKDLNIEQLPLIWNDYRGTLNEFTSFVFLRNCFHCRPKLCYIFKR